LHDEENMKATRRIIEILALTGTLACVASAQPAVSAVLNAASYSAVVSPGCWVAIFGSNLAPAPVTAPAVPLPAMLGGVSVSVAGLAAPMLYVSPNQVNALIPFEVTIPANSVLPVVVTAPGGSVTYNIRLTRNAPGIFTRDGTGTGRAFVFNTRFQTVDTIAPQDAVVLYAAGLGPADSSGHAVDEVEVYIGDRKAQVLFAGLAPGLPGIYQLNVMAPAPATDRLYLRSGGWQSNIVDIGIRSGANTANVTGTIDGFYPSSDPFFTQPPCVGDDDPGPCGAGETFSIMLHGGSFSVSFDILPPSPSASPFAIAAVGEAGGSIISIDPAAGTYTASVMTVTTAAAHGDYSGTNLQVLDYLSCNGNAVCLPFPGMQIPASRMDPFWARATQQLPVPTATVPASPNGFLEASGKLSTPRLVVDSQTNGTLSKFGGIVQVPFGPFDKRVSTFKLYVDGKLVASKDFPYGVVHR
jgi:uncharacterized protein (TIGR03437 family)